MKLYTKDGKCVEFGEWYYEKPYWFRKDIAPFNSDWAKRVGFNNAVGFVVDGGRVYHTIPRFFGSDVSFMIEAWGEFKMQCPQDIEEAKITIDNFVRLISQ